MLQTHTSTHILSLAHTHPCLSLARGHWIRGSAHTARAAQHFFLSLLFPLSLFSLWVTVVEVAVGRGVSLFLHTTESFFICLLRVPLQQGIVRACVRARVFKRFTMPEYPCPPQSENPPAFLFLKETSSEHLSVTAKQSRPL